MSDIQSVFSQLQISTPIQDLVNGYKDFFLNPADEAVQDNPDDIGNQILAQYAPEQEQEHDELDEESMEPLPSVSIDEAIAAIQLLSLYEEQQADGSSSFIYGLNSHERVLRSRKLAIQHQGDIRSYFSA